MKGIQKKIYTFEIKYIDELGRADKLFKKSNTDINILCHADMLGQMYTSQMESCLHEIIARTEEKLLDITSQDQSMKALNLLQSYREQNLGGIPFPSYVETPDWEAVKLNFQIVSAQMEKIIRNVLMYEPQSFEKIHEEINTSNYVMSVEKIPFIEFINKSKIDVRCHFLWSLFGSMAMKISTQFSIMADSLLKRACSIHYPGWMDRYTTIAMVEQYPILFMDKCSDYICEIVEEVVRYAITYSNEIKKKETIIRSFLFVGRASSVIGFSSHICVGIVKHLSNFHDCVSISNCTPKCSIGKYWTDICMIIPSHAFNITCAFFIKALKSLV